MIKIDMEMPKSCYDCGKWNYDDWALEYVCKMRYHFLGFWPGGEECEGMKSKSCPLIEDLEQSCLTCKRGRENRESCKGCFPVRYSNWEK